MIRTLCWTISLASLVAGAAEPSGTTAAKPDGGASSTPVAAAPSADTSPVGTFDALWPKRDQPGVAKKLQQLVDQNQGSADYGMLWRHAELVQWQADGIKADEYKKALGKVCWDLADQAQKKEPNRVEGYYFGAACVGAYSEGIGILSALSQGLESKFNERLDKAIQLDPRFKNCGPLIAKGRYFFKLPWPKRDLDKSAQWYQKAISECPQALRAYTWLAETQLEQDHAQQAKATLQKALDGSVDYDPPEGRRVKAMAAELQKKIAKELE